jgi:hypothetical protein
MLMQTYAKGEYEVIGFLVSFFHICPEASLLDVDIDLNGIRLTWEFFILLKNVFVI